MGHPKSEAIWDFCMDLFVAIWVCEWVLRSAIAKGVLPSNPSPQQMTQSTAFITGVLGFALGYGVLVAIGRKSDLFNRWFRVVVGFFVAVGIWQQLEAILDWKNRWAFRLLVFVIFITFAVLVLLFIIRSLGVGALLKPRFIEVALMSVASLIVIASAVFTLVWGWSAKKPPGTTISGGHILLFALIALVLVGVVVLLELLPFIRGLHTISDVASLIIVIIGFLCSAYLLSGTAVGQTNESLAGFGVFVAFVAWGLSLIFKAVFGILKGIFSFGTDTD